MSSDLWFSFPDIDPVAIWLGPVPIRWYALAYLAGFILGWRYVLYVCGLDPNKRPDKTDIDDFVPWAILAVILGGRLGYVLFYHPEFYLSHPLEALKVWSGGMAFHGGALGVAAALIIFPLRRSIPVLRLSDCVSAAAPIGLFFGRLANFINGELYGRITDQPWGIVFPAADSWPRHPSQLYQATLEGLVLFAILFALIRIKAVRDKPGIITGVFLIGYGVFRAFAEFFREPDAHIGFVMGSLSMGQILSLPMIILGFALIMFALNRGKSA